jgi:hypothetical protein
MKLPGALFERLLTNPALSQVLLPPSLRYLLPPLSGTLTLSQILLHPSLRYTIPSPHSLSIKMLTNKLGSVVPERPYPYGTRTSLYTQEINLGSFFSF